MKDWIISSQVPNLVMIENGKGSESRRLWVLNDGLINLIKLKVYSDLTRNGKENSKVRPNLTMLIEFCEHICSHPSRLATGSVKSV